MFVGHNCDYAPGECQGDNNIAHAVMYIHGQLSRSKVQRVMKKLREKGVIVHIGTKRSGYWNVDM